jgi:hypothetical protein
MSVADIEGSKMRTFGPKSGGALGAASAGGQPGIAPLEPSEVEVALSIDPPSVDES